MEHLICHHIDSFAFPVNLIAGLFLVLGTWILHRYYAHTSVVCYLTGIPATLTISSLIIFILLIEGIWALQLFRTWIFIFLLVLLILILGLVILKKVNSITPRKILFLFNHGGLWLVLTAALLGAADREEYKMIAPVNQPEYNAIDSNGTLNPLSFTVCLDKFELEYYPDQYPRIPKYFCSTVTLTSRDEQVRTTIEVNHPAHFKGYTLYQDSYDTNRGTDSPYTILLVVRDPWIGGVYAGIFLLLAGAFGLIIYGPLKKIRS